MIEVQAWTRFTGICEVKCSPEADVCGSETDLKPLCLVWVVNTAGSEEKLGGRKLMQV